MATGTSITIQQDQLLIALGSLGNAISDLPDILRIVGAYMMSSIARTFRDEGSPAGSWPRLAESTKKKKGYTAGHKLLIMSGRLFGSIQPQVTGNSVAIGTNVAYGPVHQFGSADRLGGSIGAQAKIAGRGVQVDPYEYMRVTPFRKFGRATVINEFGETETVRTRLRGPSNARTIQVSGHDRHQNIPARPYLVFRPEDPANIAQAIDAYLASKSPAVKP